MDTVLTEERTERREQMIRKEGKRCMKRNRRESKVTNTGRNVEGKREIKWREFKMGRNESE